MRTSKLHKVVMLPTEKASQLSMWGNKEFPNDELMLSSNRHKFYEKELKYQHLYFTSDEEIKQGDWYIIEHKIFKAHCEGGYEGGSCKKIVATTNGDIREYPKNFYFSTIPKIPESFIQAYIKAYNEGKPITTVDLDMEDKYETCATNSSRLGTRITTHIKTREDNTVIVHQSKMYSEQELINIANLAYWRGSNDRIDDWRGDASFADFIKDTLK